MEINNKTENIQNSRTIYLLSRFLKISLKFSSVILGLSILLILIYRKQLWEVDPITSLIVWYSIIIAVYSILFSAVTIIFMVIFYRRKKMELWKLVKKENILLVLTIGLLLILALTIYIVNYVIN